MGNFSKFKIFWKKYLAAALLLFLTSAAFAEESVTLTLEEAFTIAAENNLDSNRTIDPAKAALPVDRGGLRWRFVENVPLPCGLFPQSGPDSSNSRISLMRGDPPY